ncbi:hypothetical protein [Actinomadura sp. SCN-SB]|uniref:hypothetical protein n=1 Tax=Actinomadura sp. SCN-SB TaxID=3373092 RepID=UPI003750101F
MKLKRPSRLLTLLVVMPLAACSVPGSGRLQQPSPSRGGATVPALPAVKAFVVAADEPAPAVKRAAVRFVEVLTNYGAGGGEARATGNRLAAAGMDPSLAGQAAPLLAKTDAGAGEVIYPQIGGLTAKSASIMAVVRLSTRRWTVITTTTRTIDIRLSKRPAGWAVTRIASTGGAAPQSARALGPLAAQVLASKRIVLPDTARWDIQAGRVDTRVLRLMLEITKEHTISVTVVSTGHPFRVYGSESVSNHRQGRAVDIWAVDGRRVAEQRRGGDVPARPVAIQALTTGANEVGAPWAVSKGGRASFTNTVHQDHLHLAFKR